jgi:hypothetical protein
VKQPFRLRAYELNQAIQSMARAEKLWVVGFGDNYPLAHFARALLIRIKADIRMIPIGGFSVPEEFASIKPTDAMIALGINPVRRFSTNERWLATARGRLGWAADRWMWYVTGGAAWSGFDVNNDAAAAAIANAALFNRQPTRVNRGGWIVGVGTEYALLGGWSVKSEFLYTNFGTFGYTDSPAANACVQCYSADVKLHEYIWRVGMNYRFDWASFGKGKGPVVAKY